MKMRPILFSESMVRAILEGRKTQTRRIIRGGHIVTCDDRTGATNAKCPYGEEGDRLWVREAWRPLWDGVERDGAIGDCIQYRADMAKTKPRIVAEEVGHQFSDMCDADDPDPRWRPSIFMPRWASRITLEVVRVRVESLQSISEDDAKAEGVREVANEGTFKKFCVYDRGDTSSVPWSEMPMTAVDCYARLWDSINGVGSWSLNPWVWVVEFKLWTRKW